MGFTRPTWIASNAETARLGSHDHILKRYFLTLPGKNTIVNRRVLQDAD